ncbi:DUF4261 domain-containing protein [Saccharibacillus sp. CPCC 101409]|uniref:DUF4261 domain-containing protein n=1 Tax=Saccharibacillus sp. CPCC 101409 TaxID=3058041 RepID=UPI002671083B|nr:DUF4261 domain-containing protein [Saccharibacillus sp. CPCC 101409]MDO3408962.1 DUF4261 domain-containing protein [Saccharibacillus sp. CPCC 101409]
MVDSTEEEKKENRKLKPGFAPVYAVELLFREEPQLDAARILQAIHARIRKTAINTGPFRETERIENEALRRKETTGSDEFELAAVFYHGDYSVNFTDGEVPAQTRLFRPRLLRQDVNWNGVLEQSWKWEGGAERLGEYRYAVTLCDWYAAMLPFERRLEMFQAVLASVIETMGCDALYWQPSGQLIDAGSFLSSHTSEPLYGALNVRVYDMQSAGGREGEVLVDTIGLTALGMADIQCRVAGLTPDRVIPLIYGAAYYLFGNGGEIDNGVLLGGAGLKWRCERQRSALAPERIVIDLNPGRPFYAGTQTEQPVDPQEAAERPEQSEDGSGWPDDGYEPEEEQDYGPETGYKLRDEDGTEFRSEREFRQREREAAQEERLRGTSDESSRPSDSGEPDGFERE